MNRRERKIAEQARGTTSAAEAFERSRPTFMRLVLVWQIPLAIGAYLVGKTHGVPVVVAAVLSIACGVTALVLCITWPKHSSRRHSQAAVALVVVSFWPAPVWPAWTLFAGAFGALIAGAAWVFSSMYRGMQEIDRDMDAMEAESKQKLAEARREYEASAHTPMHPFRRRR